MKNADLKKVMTTAWMLVKKCGFTMSEALKASWKRTKLVAKMSEGIVKFYFQKVDGSIREAYGTLKEGLLPPTSGNSRKNDTLQVYYDTEVEGFRCFKIANLLRIA